LKSFLNKDDKISLIFTQMVMKLFFRFANKTEVKLLLVVQLCLKRPLLLVRSFYSRWYFWFTKLKLPWLGLGYDFNWRFADYQQLTNHHLPLHSLLKLVTGLATATLIAYELIVINAIMKAINAAAPNIHHDNSVR